jgi:fatty acid desaturase
MSVFARFDTETVGSNPTQGIHICPFNLFVVSRPCVGLIPHRKIPTDCVQDRKTEKTSKAQQMAAHLLMIVIVIVIVIIIIIIIVVIVIAIVIIIIIIIIMGTL